MPGIEWHPMDDWYDVIAAESELPPDAARQLCDLGFVIMPGPVLHGGCARLSEAYDRVVLMADPADVSIRSSTRVSDFVNRGPELDGLYIYGPVLAACCRIIGRPFKLSTMHARTLEPGTPAQPLHVDVKRGADGWPLVGFILGQPGAGVRSRAPLSHGRRERRSTKRRVFVTRLFNASGTSRSMSWISASRPSPRSSCC